MGAAAQRRRPFRAQDAAGPQLHGVDARQQPVIGQQRGVKLVEVLPEVGFQRAVAGEEIDGAVGLVVAMCSVQQHLVTPAAEFEMEGMPLVAHAGVVHVIPDGVLAFGNQLQGFLPHQPGGVGLVVVDGGQHRLLPKRPNISSSRSWARLAADISARESPSSRSG